MNVLSIGAHPADVFDQAGGTLANFAADGHGVYIAVVTHGAYSHAQLVAGKGKTLQLEEVSALKRKECDAAAQYVGAKEVEYLGFDDEPFIPTRETTHALASYIRKVRPQIIIMHHPGEYSHPDHPVVGEMAMRSIKAAERWLEGSQLEPHSVKSVYFFGTQFRSISATLGWQVLSPDFVVDITRSIDKKKKAIAAFETQSYAGAKYEEKWVAERIERLEGYWGLMNGLKYAEEFIAFTPQIVSLLP
ncbi:MAG: PIG-L deacetylase family protein [Terriglobales bacterium]